MLGVLAVLHLVSGAPPSAPAQEGFGWHVNPRTPTARARIDKGGGSADFASHLLYYPEERVVIVWATNNLRQRWRRTLNQAIPAIVFGDSPLGASLLPIVQEFSIGLLTMVAGRYVAGRDTLDLRAADGHLYALDNRLGVPADVMFFPNQDRRFTAIDPATGAVTHLESSDFRGRSLDVVLADGRRITANR